jgi:hypothetical protein
MTGMPRIATNLALAFEQLFKHFQHHLEEDEVVQINLVLSSLKVAL